MWFSNQRRCPTFGSVSNKSFEQSLQSSLYIPLNNSNAGCFLKKTFKKESQSLFSNHSKSQSSLICDSSSSSIDCVDDNYHQQNNN